ncbi:hypothetical protein AFLA_008313 [Aspergillus flavus NRRL3357]|nr:hypothetical protein AFLA_008313 [Aspergillus flavus NRRL3357]
MAHPPAGISGVGHQEDDLVGLDPSHDVGTWVPQPQISGGNATYSVLKVCPSLDSTIEYPPSKIHSSRLHLKPMHAYTSYSLVAQNVVATRLSTMLVPTGFESITLGSSCPT